MTRCLLISPYLLWLALAMSKPSVVQRTDDAAPLVLAPSDVANVVGIRQNGKSTFTRERIVKPARRVITWSCYSDYLANEMSLAELFDNPDVLDEPGLKLSVVEPYEDPADYCAAFVDFAGLVKSCADTVIVVDEVGLLDEGRAPQALKVLATQSAHYGPPDEPGCPLVLVAQYATQIPKGVRRQASQIVSFYQDEPSDIAALAERIGEKLAAQVPKLGPYEFVHWRGRAGDRPQKEKA